jgi:hypothetical protein
LLFFYQSGEQINKGDRVTFEIEFVAEAPEDPETKWYVEDYGGGVMVVELEPTVFRRVFVTETDEAEDLVFVSRSKGHRLGIRRFKAEFWANC